MSRLTRKWISETFMMYYLLWQFFFFEKNSGNFSFRPRYFSEFKNVRFLLQKVSFQKHVLVSEGPENRKNRLFECFTLKWPQSRPLPVGVTGEMIGAVLKKLWPFWWASFFFFFYYFKIFVFFNILEKYPLKNDMYLELTFSFSKTWPNLVATFL